MASAWSTRVVLLGASFLAACGGDPDPAAPPPIDPKVACETKATWTKGFDCLDCQSRAAQPACDCNPSPYNAVCYEQNLNRLNGCDKAVLDCESACKADCNCIDACYQSAAACRANAAAFDGCIVQMCGTVCR